MDFKTIAEKLELSKEDHLFNLHKDQWKLSQDCLSEDGLFFLCEKYITRVMEIINLPEDAISKAVSVAKKIMSDKILIRLIWHSYYVLYISKDFPEDMIKDWQLGLGYEESYDDFVTFFLAMAGIPKMKELYFKLRIPDEVLNDTLDYLKLWAEEYRRKHGRWGFDNFLWYYNHQQKGNLFRIGRLEHEISRFRFNIRAYKNTKDGRIIAFWADDIKYRSDGQINGTNDIFDKHPKETIFIENDYTITGTPINPAGFLEGNPVDLPKEDWKLILKKDDPVLSIHIPGSRKLDPDSVKKSYIDALAFFKEYFPKIEFKAFFCCTWFLDNQFRILLGEESNIAHFQKPFYLFPILGDDRGVFHWVFGEKPDNIDELPQNTNLHRTIVQHYKAGKKFRMAAGFIAIENNKT